MLLFLLFLLASSAHSCEKVATDCKDYVLNQSKSTIEGVIADIKQNLDQSSEFFVKFETDLHTFAIELESKLMADKIMLERLLKLQERHGKKFTNTTEFGEICENEICQSLVKNVTACGNCTTPVYDDKYMIYTCVNNYAFDASEDSGIQEARQVRCDFSDSKVGLVYEGSEKNETFNGHLTCHPLEPKETKTPCPYTCAETAQCSESKLVCACLKGYIDVSAQYNKSVGSICTKCNNSDPHGTDYVMLFDLSHSTRSKENVNRKKMIDFMSDFLTFIDVDSSDNRFALIEFSDDARLRFPLTPKTNARDIVEAMRNETNVYGFGTNTPLAMKSANEQVYAESDSKRPRVTILFTDGEPKGFYSPFTNKTFDTYNNAVMKNMMMDYLADLKNKTEKNTGKKVEIDDLLHDLTMKDLKPETRAMREDHKAQIITIYIGRKVSEQNTQMMRVITSEDEELSVDNFDDLKETVLDRLQLKIC